jgi:hypothetical protein
VPDPPVSSVPLSRKGEVESAPLAEPVISSDVETVVPLSVMLEFAGAAPAPPPLTSVLAVSAAEVAHVLAELKYGIPPLVPATVNAGVVVGVPTEIKPPVNDTLVTVAELVLQVEQAIAPAAEIVIGDVPLNPLEPTLPIGSCPDTSVAKLTAPNVGAPAALP